MDKIEFSLLTKEEIDATIAEVLEEAGLARRAGRGVSRAGKAIKRVGQNFSDAGREFKKGKDLEDADVGDTIGDMSDKNLDQTVAADQELRALAPELSQDASEAEREKARRAAAAGGGGPSAGAPSGRPPAAGGSSSGTSTTGAPEVDDIQAPAGYRGRGDPGMSSAMRTAQKRGNLPTAAADGSLGAKDPRGLGQQVWDKVTGKKAPEAGDVTPGDEQGIKSADAASGNVGEIGEPWFQPGSSDLPKAVRQRILSNPIFASGETSPEIIITNYVQAVYGSNDVTALLANDLKKATMARVYNYTKKAQQSGDPAHAMQLRRVLDDLANQTIKAAKVGGADLDGDGKGDAKDPPEELPAEKEKEFIKNQKRDPMTWMTRMHQQDKSLDRVVDVEKVQGLAKAVSKDLALNERRQPKEMENTLIYLADFEKDKRVYAALKKLLTGYLKTTQYQLGPDTAELLGFAGKPQAQEDPQTETEPEDAESEDAEGDPTADPDPGAEEEAPEDADPEADPDSEIKRTFGLHSTFKLQKIGKQEIRASVFLDQFSKNYDKLKQKNGWTEGSWESDFAAFLDELGKIKRKVKGKGEEEAKGLEESGIRASVLAPYFPEEAKKLVRTLFMKLEQTGKDTPAGRALEAIRQKRGRTGDPKKALGPFLAALWKNLTFGGKKAKGVGTKTGMSASAPEEERVDKMSQAMAAGRFDENKEATDDLLEESVINRWKTLSGAEKVY